MTLQEIGERLRAEFPDNSVSFDVEDAWHGNASKTINITITLYEPSTGFIKGFGSLDEGVVMLKRALGMIPPADCDLNISVGDATVEL